MFQCLPHTGEGYTQQLFPHWFINWHNNTHHQRILISTIDTHIPAVFSVRPGKPTLNTTPVVAGRRFNISCTSDGRPPPTLQIHPQQVRDVEFETLGNQRVNRTHTETVVSAIANKSLHNQWVYCDSLPHHVFGASRHSEIKLDCLC